MLIMSWLYTQKSGDGVLIDTYVRFVRGFNPNLLVISTNDLTPPVRPLEEMG